MFGFLNMIQNEKVQQMPCRREFCYEYQSPSLIAARLSADLSYVLRLRRASFRSLYTTGEFIRCTAYYKEDFSEIYLEFICISRGEESAPLRYKADPRIFLGMIEENG